jgi:hypothetical protein
MSSLVFGAVALDDPFSLRVGDLRIVLFPHLVSSIIVACAADAKNRGKVPIPDTMEGIARFAHVVSTVAVSKKTIALLVATGSDVTLKRFEAQASQGLARAVTRFSDLTIVPNMAPVVSTAAVAASVSAASAAAPASPRTLKAAAKAAAKVAAAETPLFPQGPTPAPLDLWAPLAAELLLTIIIESIMSMWQRPATMTAAVKLSMESAQAHLRRDLADEDLAVCAGLVVMKRHGDFALVWAELPTPLRNISFSADLLAHLSPMLKAKVALFDEAAAISVPPGESFLLRLASPAGQAACTAQLGSWALAAKTDKANLVKAVQMQVAALGLHPPVAGVPPPARAPVGGTRRTETMTCLSCENAGRPAVGHTRETCAHYTCKGCGRVAPGHIWRNCPDPSVGGLCPPHTRS